MDILRCKTPELVRKEIWTPILACNLIRPRNILPNKMLLEFARKFCQGAHWNVCVLPASLQNSIFVTGDVIRATRDGLESVLTQPLTAVSRLKVCRACRRRIFRRPPADCREMYMVEEAKRLIENNQKSMFDETDGK